MSYQSVRLQEQLKIDEVFSIHYFEYMSDFYFPGETHDFWEFLCVDKGTVEVYAGDRLYTLQKGDIIFHKPNEFHNVKADGRIAPNLLVISFACHSPAMSFFEDRVLQIRETERLLLAQIIQETRYAFLGRMDDPWQQQLVRSNTPRFAGEQLIKLYLEQLLIQMIRHNTAPRAQTQPPMAKSFKQKADAELFRQITAYMEAHVCENLSIEQICRSNSVGRSQLQKVFRSYVGLGVIEFFSRMKVERAKRMIREDCFNFTQIADSLGFSSIHYFSRQFKHTTGMTPSEYASSIKVFSDRTE